MANSSMVNLSITIKSYQFVGNKYRASDFLKKQRNKERKLLLDTLQKMINNKKMNNKHSQVFLEIRVSNVQKKSQKMKLRVK